LKKHERELIGNDPFFMVEATLLKMLSGPAATTRINDKISDVFPNAAKFISLDDCLASCRLLQASEGFNMLPNVCQSNISFAIKLVMAISSGTTGELKMGSVSPLWAGIWARCPHFFSCEAPAEAGKILTGAPAIIAFLDKGTTKGGKKKRKKAEDAEEEEEGAIDDDVAHLSLFDFCVPHSHVAAFNALCKKGAAAPKPKAKAAAAKKKAKLEIAAEQASRDADAMFA